MRPPALDPVLGSGSPFWGAGAQTHLQRPEKTENASALSEAGGRGAGAGRGPEGRFDTKSGQCGKEGSRLFVCGWLGGSP